MTSRRQYRFVIAQVAWMTGAIVALALVGEMSYEVFFVVSLIGFLGLVELTTPFNVTPRWRSRLRWLVLLGLLGFGVVVVRRVLEFLPSEIF